MDDRIEHSGDTAATTSNAIGRREMLQRTGFVVGAAALWATPVVQTMGMRPASAETGSPVVADFCVDCVGAAPVELIFEYIPSGFGTPIGAGGVKCDPYALEAASGDPFDPDVRVDIKVVMGQGGNAQTRYFCDVGVNDRIQVLWPGGSPGSLTPRIEATITAVGTTTPAQVIRIHTSCSSELRINDVFKSLTLRWGDDGANTAGISSAFDFAGELNPC